MFKVLEMNKENLLKSSNKYNCEDRIYKILLKTGQYAHVSDIIYFNIIIIILINIL